MVDLEIEGVVDEEDEEKIEKPDESAIEIARATRLSSDYLYEVSANDWYRVS